MKQYQELIKTILANGASKDDRTGTGTRSIFGYQMRFNLADGFPLVTTKKCHIKSIIHELLWFLSGDTNIKYLNDNGVKIWNEWADDNGDLGKVYGHQWRKWSNVNLFNTSSDTSPINEPIYYDQIERLIKNIKTNPDSRRLIVSSWNVGDLPFDGMSPQDNVLMGKMALAPCHALFQFYVANGKLSCQLYQRSCDVFLGLPFNIASYSLLTHMIAQQCNLDVGEFVWTGGDTHLYNNHIEQANLLLSREPRELPTLKINRKPESIFDYKYDDFEIINYNPHDAIKAPIAV